MHEELMEEVVKVENMREALARVVSNDGACGIDKMTARELETHVVRHWESLSAKLLRGEYTPSPVKRVEIPKPGGGVRALGIPTAMDRLIQQMLAQVLVAIFDPEFSPHSYGFRPGRSAHQAVRQAQEYVGQGKEWVVDMDISEFFDRVNHDILMGFIGRKIRDKRVLKLIGRYLRSGVMIEGVVIATQEGTPQGGPLSPLLANIYLDPLDQELQRRNLSFCRYADDCNIYVSSPRAAQRVMESIGEWIEQVLKLKLNTTKSGSGRPWERKFLGFRITQKAKTEVAPENLRRFRDKVRELWRSCQSLTSKELRKQWRVFVGGWWNYFRLASEKRSVFDLEPWCRRKIRACFWVRWHNAKGRTEALRKLGLRGPSLKVARSSKGAWLIAKSRSLHTALSNRVLRRAGLWVPSDFAASG